MSIFRPPKPGFLQLNAWSNQYQNSLQYNTSQAGSVVPLLYGTSRQSVNLVDFGNYRGPTGKKGKSTGPLPIGGTPNRTGKGGGGKSSKKNPGHYTVDVEFAMCEGEVGILADALAWSSSGVAQFSKLNLLTYLGHQGQGVDPTFAGLGRIVGYSQTCIIAGTPMDLGQSPALPNISVEISGFFAQNNVPDNGRTQDAPPGNIALDFLTNSLYGAGFPSANVDPNLLNDYGNYCSAANLWMSPALQSQTEAQEWLTGLAKLTNSAIVWSSNLLKIIPYGDLPISYNGYTWVPNLVPVYNLNNDDCFLPWQSHDTHTDLVQGEDDPIIITRSNPADATNWLEIEYLDRTNFYNPNVLAVFDQNAIDQYGLRKGPSLPGHAFCAPSRAQISAQLLLQRQQFMRNTYKFQIGWQYSLLEPMDIVLITDSRMGITNAAVRVTSIEENENGDLIIEGEEIVTQIIPPGPTCNLDLLWTSNWVATNYAGHTGNYQTMSSSLDNFGNFYLSGRPIWSSSGSVNADYTCTNMADAIDAWFGSTVVNRGVGFTGTDSVLLGPIMSGQYVLGYMQAASGTGVFSHWFGVFQPESSGSPTLLGAVRVNNLLGPPYLNIGPWMVSNDQEITDPILFIAGYGLSGQFNTISVLPSVNDIISGTYKSGYGVGYASCELPNVYWQYLATANLTEWLFHFTGSAGDAGGWCLPDGSHGTNFYAYFSRSYTEFCVAGGAGTCPEVGTVIGPSYPHGSVIKIPLGVLIYSTLAAYAIAHGNLGTTPMYSIDNSDWVDSSGNVQVPFSDEYHYMSTGASGGTDAYFMRPSLVTSPPFRRGLWQVIMLMSGISDFSNYGTGHKYDTVRIFQYNPSTQQFTQASVMTCIAFNDPGEIAGGAGSDSDIIASWRGNDLVLTGYCSGPGIGYATDFATIFY